MPPFESKAVESAIRGSISRKKAAESAIIGSISGKKQLNLKSEAA